MASSPIKPVRFYKIGGLKQSDSFKNQNLNPSQLGYGNQYPFMFYPIQFNGVTSQSHSPSIQRDYDSKNIDKYNKMQNIEEDDESQLEAIQENREIEKNEKLENEIKEETKKKDSEKSEKFEITDKLNQKNKLNNSTKSMDKEENSRQIKTFVKNTDEKDFDSVFGRKKKETMKTDKTTIDTIRSKDEKPFSIRGTTKTVIEMTTSEVFDQNITRTKDDTQPKFFKNLAEKVKNYQDKKTEQQDIENKLNKKEEILNEEIFEKKDKNIQTDADTDIVQILNKNVKPLNKTVDRETETSESMIDRFLDDREKFKETNFKKMIKPSKPTDHGQDHSLNKKICKTLVENIYSNKINSHEPEKKTVFYLKIKIMNFKSY